MTYCEQMNRLEAVRLDVTRERTGFAFLPEGMTAAAYAADLAEARERDRLFAETVTSPAGLAWLYGA
jgi:hypothetical protein